MTDLRARLNAVKRDIRALGFAFSDRRTPWYVKALAGCVVAYAISPIDLIPDPIPVLGYLDDAILIPAGIWLVVRLMPPELLAECRRRADEETPRRSWLRWVGATVVLIIWGGVLWLAIDYGRAWFD